MSVASPGSESRRPAPPLVLVVNDSELTRAMALQDLTTAGFRAMAAATIDEGLAILMSRQVHVILLDIELPRGDGARKEARAGIQAIPEFLHEAPGAEIIMFSQHDHAELGMEALRRGATDFVVKPHVPELLVSAVERALERKRNRREIEQLREELHDLKGGPVFFGNGDKMRAVRKLIAAAAPTDATVLITGETGTGKELVARTLHAESARSKRPMVAVNLAAIPRDLVESALFGHERGAFTGAVRPQIGRFEAAEMFEQDFILKTLARCRWNRNEAAARLAIHKATLFRKLNRYGLYGTAVAPVRWQRGSDKTEPDKEPRED